MDTPTLPLELFLLIFAELERRGLKRTLANLIRASSELLGLGAPVLFRKINTIEMSREAVAAFERGIPLDGDASYYSGHRHIKIRRITTVLMCDPTDFEVSSLVRLVSMCVSKLATLSLVLDYRKLRDDRTFWEDVGEVIKDRVEPVLGVLSSSSSLQSLQLNCLRWSDSFNFLLPSSLVKLDMGLPARERRPF